MKIVAAAVAGMLIMAGSSLQAAGQEKASPETSMKPPASGKEKAGTVKDRQGSAKPRAEMTKDEIVKDIENILARDKEVEAVIPRLGRVRDAEGNEYLTYSGSRLNDLDKKELDTFYGLILRQRSRIRSERLQRQMESLAQVQRMAGIAQQQANIAAAQQAARVAEQAGRNPAAPVQPARMPPSPPRVPPTTRR